MDWLEPDGLGELTKDVFRYWRSISPGPGLLPGRQHFDPLDIPAPLLPHIWLLDVEHGPPLRFRARLVGTAISRSGPMYRVGTYVEPDHALPGRTNFYNRLVELLGSPEPDHYAGPPLLPGLVGRVRALSRITLPMARDGRTVDMFLNATVLEWEPGLHGGTGLLDIGITN